MTLVLHNKCQNDFQALKNLTAAEVKMTSRKAEKREVAAQGQITPRNLKEA